MKAIYISLVAALMTANAIVAEPTKTNCHCQNCTCTIDNHCGCFAEKGCHCQGGKCSKEPDASSKSNESKP